MKMPLPPDPPQPLSTDLVTPERASALRALDNAPTVLEALFWGMVLGHPRADELYLAELIVTDLVGYGNVPDDFRGEL